MTTYYTASKTKNPGRDAWTVIFRHPTRLDRATGRPGRRVRRGLGTADDARAEDLVAQLNELLATPELWEPSAREVATTRFDDLVVDIFYDGTEQSAIDFSAIRDELLPLPSSAHSHPRVLLLGTTGAGKTTLIRQLLGTDPKTERFPSTSTAKTTVADTEIVLTPEGPFRAAITFVARDEVVDYLSDNVSSAALAAHRGGRSDAELTRKLLDHVNQRFRFSYVLGRPMGDNDDDDVTDEVDPEDAGLVPSELGIDLNATENVVRSSVAAIRSLVETLVESVAEPLDSEEDDGRVVEEVIEEQLDMELRQTEEFHRIVDVLMEEIEKRFAALTVGELSRNRQGWPVSWAWSTSDRTEFIRTIGRFSSNYALFFGALLTPLVNGTRVTGPFIPAWLDSPVPLVLIDGEGLGHTPKSASTLSTAVVRQIEGVDSILLVDNATQPMQAAPVAAMKAVVVSGQASKLSFVFTHFDQVTGDNLPTFSAREEHVRGSAENALGAIGDELGPAAERVLRSRLAGAVYFVGDIQDVLDPGKRAGNRSIMQLQRMVDRLVTGEEVGETGPCRPVIDRMNLSLAVTAAAQGFHRKWRAVLGFEFDVDVPKEHWARVKALSRRLAEGWSNEYDNLRPIADLLFELQAQIYLMLQKPLRWENGEPDDDEKQIMIDAISNAVTARLIELTERRLRNDVRAQWQDAYAQRGRGSTFVRARIIAADIYDRGAPVPTAAAAPDQNRFLREVATVLTEVADELELILE